MHGLTFDSSNKQLHQCQLVQFLFVVVYKFPSLMCEGNQNNTKKNPYCVLLISLLDMQNNVLSAAAVPLFLEAKRLFCSVRFQKEKLADQWSRLASVTPLGHDKRSVLTVGPWPNCQIAKQHKIKTLKTITQSTFLRSKMQPTTTEKQSIMIIFLETKVKQAEP